MPTKVRKQIYLEQQQNRQLKRLAEARGVSEAEVVRQLINAEAVGSAGKPLPTDREAWESILEFAKQRAQSGLSGEPYKWNRQEIYDERESRFGPLVVVDEIGDKSAAQGINPQPREAKPIRQPAAQPRTARKKQRYAVGPD